MTYQRPRLRPSVTRRQSTAAVAFLSLGTENEVAMPQYRKPVKRGKQPESASNDAVKQWARLKGGVLYRNRRGMVELSSGAKMPIGLGPNGYADNVGYLPVKITADMIGRTVAVFTMVECKRADKAMKTPDPDDPQLLLINEVRDAGGIAGFAQHAEDCEDIMKRWRLAHVPF